jgi:hypothetical protein
MSLYDRLKAVFTGRSDDPDVEAQNEAARILEMSEPMAGAGALLSGSHRKSETERELEAAANHGKPPAP